MANYYLTNKAVDDLTQIWDYTYQKWPERQADKYYKELLRACKKIVTNSELGKKHVKIYPDLFGLPINRHIIFFRRIDPDFVEITRILHDQIDLKTE
ncbi:toxin ParE1/3/4 [Mariniphaga anaerophila]|uniref:Toxin n=1 Tax=Mariniphaga anaerophila TaxID=1484053 RepID=A0A1M5A297_9BACT|nr:type II toxin-antitoxin system RelE/ParE family toxin [Mariniphaga anaerophila]SHF24500.1 toxin ParE1/3/4 [Mariniphaga anaerophila]